MSVTDLTQYRRKKEGEDSPHVTGPARCLDCKNEWIAVAPDATVWLECPACALVRGRFIYQHEKSGGEEWECSCGNNLFKIAREGAYCPNCGEWQRWGKE